RGPDLPAAGAVRLDAGEAPVDPPAPRRGSLRAEPAPRRRSEMRDPARRGIRLAEGSGRRRRRGAATATSPATAASAPRGNPGVVPQDQRPIAVLHLGGEDHRLAVEGDARSLHLDMVVGGDLHVLLVDVPGGAEMDRDRLALVGLDDEVDAHALAPPLLPGDALDLDDLACDGLHRLRVVHPARARHSAGAVRAVTRRTRLR